VPSNLLLDDALNLAIDYGRTVYDSLFVALAIREGCQLITADERLVNAVAQKLPQVVLLSSWSASVIVSAFGHLQDNSLELRP
jgi:predicted nucleic acid-binding protein